MTEICRICLTEMCNLERVNILNKFNEDVTIFESIVTISSVQVLEKDILPQSICSQCYIQLQQFYVFRNLIISSDTQLKQQLNNNFELIQEQTPSIEQIHCLEYKDFMENHDSASTEQNIDMKVEFDNNLLDKSDSNTDVDVIDTPPKVKRRRKNIKTNFKIKNIKLEKKLECVECGRTFKKTDHLNVHIAYKHSEKKIKCEICNKKFARKYDLVYHTRVHTGERPFTCELCGKSFASSSYFYVHKRMHTGYKKMECKYCENSFINSDQLQIHIRQKHTGERPYLCESCSQAFTSSSALFRHKRDVHDEKVQCPLCKKLYSSRVLKEHIKRHKEREEGIKRFSCDLCNKRFTCATSRKRHLVIHSGEKAFKCEVCLKAFNQRSTLQTHMRIHSQIMPFQCDICSKSFRYKHHLKLHCEKHHKNEEYQITSQEYSDIKQE